MVFFFAAIMPLKDGYRGSLIFSTTETTTGNCPNISSTPASVTRVMTTFLAAGSTVTADAKVSCAQLRRSAIIAGTTLMRASVDSVPQITTSNSPFKITLANTFDVVSASAPTSFGSLIKIALFAPIDSAFRTASVARSGPIEITVTVFAAPSSFPPCASAMRNPSSTAYSSRSLRTASTFIRSSRPLTIFFSAQESGTCLIQMAIFMSLMLLISR